MVTSLFSALFFGKSREKWVHLCAGGEGEGIHLLSNRQRLWQTYTYRTRT